MFWKNKLEPKPETCGRAKRLQELRTHKKQLERAAGASTHRHFENSFEYGLIEAWYRRELENLL